jgi:hypothetical protein
MWFVSQFKRAINLPLLGYCLSCCLEHNLHSLITSLVIPVSETIKQINFLLAAIRSDVKVNELVPKHQPAMLP